VFIEDAIQTNSDAIGARSVSQIVDSLVLGTPKPTTFQHYLVQTSADGKESIHWDARSQIDEKNEATLRGHKMYWHRPGAPLTSNVDASPKVTSHFQKGLKGCEFQTRIRFENLSLIELGLLLTAVELPDGCAHKLGMAEPYGLGSMAISIRSLTGTDDRRSRYSSFFASKGELQAADQDLIDKVKDSAKAEFAKWYIGKETASDPTSELWMDLRLNELKSLLTWKQEWNDHPAQRELWLGKTRYLGFGSVEAPPGRVQSYNEYKNLDYKNPPTLGNRRPLPPASQVLNEQIVPDDPQPRWLSNAERKAIRDGTPQNQNQRRRHRSDR
jgi:hypothetical protein